MLRIGMIGAGAIAHYAFLPGFSIPDSARARIALPDWDHNGCPEAQVVAIASRTRPKAEALAQIFGIPRVYDIALETISHGDGRVDSENLGSFVAAYQTGTALKLGELWAIPIMLRLALIENLRRIGTRILAGIADNYRLVFAPCIDSMVRQVTRVELLRYVRAPGVATNGIAGWCVRSGRAEGIGAVTLYAEVALSGYGGTTQAAGADIVKDVLDLSEG